MTGPRLLETVGLEAYAYPLMIRRLLPPPGSSAEEIVSEGRRFTYRQFIERTHRLASGFHAQGVRAGDTVAMMDWDSHRYLACYFAVPAMGAILQTVNVRLSVETITFTLRQSGASVLLYHHDFAPMVEAMRPHLNIGHYVSFGAQTEPDAFEALVEQGDPEFVFEDFDENAIATTFHTTGTTGDPKQVFFTHRQLVLHTLTAATALANQPDGQGARRSDVYMPITPMFHVHAWGLPYVATMLGLKQVYPGRYDPAALLRLKQQEGVTFSHCVPTILRMLIDAARASGLHLRPWAMVIGGSGLPEALADEAAEIGINVIAGYGMSETGPIIALSRSQHGDPTRLRCRAGMPVPLVELALDPSRGNELTVRAPWLTQGYATQDASDALWQGGRLHTGDVAEIDADGGVRIVDRLKDVIKTGGEWVSSIEIEDLLMSAAGVAEVAVIGVPDARWGERPVAFVRRAEVGLSPTAETLLAEMAAHAGRGAISRFAIPDRIVFTDALPRTSVGKIDKKQLRLNLQNRHQ